MLARSRPKCFGPGARIGKGELGCGSAASRSAIRLTVVRDLSQAGSAKGGIAGEPKACQRHLPLSAEESVDNVIIELFMARLGRHRTLLTPPRSSEAVLRF
jgi:hypothetical protein